MKFSLKTVLDKLPLLFYKIWFIYIYIPTHIYVWMCKTHTNSKQSSINRELIKTNLYAAQLTRSLILNSDWSKQVYFSKY